MGRAFTLAYVGAIFLMVLFRPGSSLARDWRSPEDEPPAPVWEAPDPVTRAPCIVLPHVQRHGFQYIDTTEEIASGVADIMAPLKPGNYSYSGSYLPDDPCRYD